MQLCGEAKVDEDIESCFVAMVNYSVMALIQCELGLDGEQDLPLERAMGRAIEKQLRHYDAGYDPASDLTLSDLPVGSLFRLKNGRGIVFKSLEKRRTRYRCIDVDTNVAYYVAGAAPVSVVQ